MVEPFTSRDTGRSGAVPRASSPRTRCCVTRPSLGPVEQTEPGGLGRGLPRVGTAELAQDRRDVVVDRPRARRRGARRSRVAQPLRDEPEHLDLALGEVAGSSASTGAGRAGARARRARAAGGRRSPRRPPPSACSSSRRRRSCLLVLRVGERERGLVGAADPLQSSAARCQSPRSCRANGSAAPAGHASWMPACRRQQASSPTTHAASLRIASARHGSVSRATRRRSPSSQAASARATATGARCCRSPPSAGELERLVEQAAVIGIAAAARAPARARRARGSRAGRQVRRCVEDEGGCVRPPRPTARGRGRCGAR